MPQLRTADGKILKEVGQIAFRDPKGEITGKQPLYIIVSEKEVNPETQLLPQEEATFSEVGKIFAEKFGQYVRECRKQGIKI